MPNNLQRHHKMKVTILPVQTVIFLSSCTKIVVWLKGFFSAIMPTFVVRTLTCHQCLIINDGKSFLSYLLGQKALLVLS